VIKECRRVSAVLAGFLVAIGVASAAPLQSTGTPLPLPLCFVPNQPQPYILPDNDQLFFPKGTVKLDQVIQDFGVGSKLENNDADDNYYAIKLKGGYRAAFALLKGDVLQVEFEATGSDPQSTLKERCQFIRDIQQRGLSDRYLVKNTYEEMEKLALAQENSNIPPVQPTIVQEPEDFQKEDLRAYLVEPNAVLMIPDQHGETKYLDRFLRIAVLPEVQWVNLEVVPDTMSSVLKDYMTEKEGSPKFIAADQQFITFFTNFFSYNGFGTENPIYQALKYIKALNKPINAMDADEFYSAQAHEQSQMDESFFYESRNANWASHTPTQGRGVVYGGSEHFNSKGNTRFQDFYALRSQSKQFLLSR
jgi:hypothetical protein